MKILLLSILLCVAYVGFAQQPDSKGKASIIISNDQSIPLEGATVELLRSKDSVLVKTAISDKLGSVEFENIKLGTYLMKISMVNHASTYTPQFSLTPEQSSLTISPVALKMQTGQLKDVTVTTRKPVYRKT
jgi:uncharacterized surface anchored protein